MKKDKCVIGKEVVMLHSDYDRALKIFSEVIVTNRVAYVDVTSDDGYIQRVPISRLQDKKEYDSIMNCYVGCYRR